LNSSKDVRVLVPGWTDAGLEEIGITSFNEVQAKPGSETIMKFEDWPLLVSGRYGNSHTLAFMAYTPTDKQVRPEYLALYGQMLTHALGREPAYRYATVAPLDKPLMQLLKEQPAAALKSHPGEIEAQVKDNGGKFSVAITNGERFARLVRFRMEWEDPDRQPYVMLYEDNYFDLFRGERKTVPVEFRMSSPVVGAVKGTLLIEGTNMAQTRVPVRLVQ